MDEGLATIRSGGHCMDWRVRAKCLAPSGTCMLLLFLPFRLCARWHSLQQISVILSHWATLLGHYGREHRALPLLVEAVDLVKQPTDDHETAALFKASSALGDTLQ